MKKFITYGFTFFLFMVMLLSVVLKDEEFSILERRRLAVVPKIATIFKGDYFNELDAYFSDHFPMRDNLRYLKGIVSSNLFQEKENDGAVIIDDAIYALDPALDEKSLKHFTNILNKIAKSFKSKNLYYSVIPDKNYYLNADIPKLNYDKLFNNLASNLNFEIKYIDITECLNLTSYYRTDIHFRQENLADVANKLALNLNIKLNLPEEEKVYESFYGALYGRVANNLKPDKITYLTNKIVKSARVFDFETNSYLGVYDENNLKHIDSYDIFLAGPKALLTIYNDEKEDGELVIFRDSFASSLVPLLIGSYHKITLVDLRYFSSNMLELADIDYNSKDLDVLFLYSVPIINNSYTLK